MKESALNKKLGLTLGVLCCLYAAFFLLYMWFNIVSPTIFMKISITFGVIALLVIGCYLLWHEFVYERKLRDDKYTN